MIKSIITFLYFNNFFEKKLEQAYKILEKNKQIDLVYKIKKILKTYNTMMVKLIIHFWIII